MSTHSVSSMFRTWRLSLILIFMTSLGAAVSMSHAQEGTTDQNKLEDSIVAPLDSPSDIVTRSTKKQVSKVLPNPKKAAKSQFDSEKEQRLEDLRYKHLWIAYSFVWIIIFIFIRQTWSRSQAVSSRLEELKVRLIKLEEKGE